jgi:hypothetical protein
MKKNFNIDNPSFKESPFSVPEGYFSELRSSVSERISQQEGSGWSRFRNIARPQLALVSSFVMIFIIAFGVFTIFSPNNADQNEVTIISYGSQYIEEGFLRTTFVDFFDYDGDTLEVHTNQINTEELIAYISDNVNIITLASLE